MDIFGIDMGGLIKEGKIPGVQGYTKITPGSGLRVYIKDFNKLHPIQASLGNDKTK